MRLDPKSFEAAILRASVRRSGKAEEAVKWFEARNRCQAGRFRGPRPACDYYSGLGRTEDSTRTSRRAYDAARRHLELNPDNPRALYMGAMSLSNLGESAKARDWNRRALQWNRRSSVLYNIACAFAVELREEAMNALDQAIDKGFGHW